MTKAKWLIHMNDGKTLTSQDCLPQEAPQEEITSVERVVSCRDGKTRTAVIAKSKVLTNFFVKTTASKAMDMFGKKSLPTQIEQRIVGAFLPPQKTPTRIELGVDKKTGTVILRVWPDVKMTKDGF